MIYNMFGEYETNIYQDVGNLISYCDGLMAEMGILNTDIDTDKLVSVLQQMRYEFPHVDGLNKSSPFKKIANFVVYFVSIKPILTPFPDKIKFNTKQINTIPNHQNAFMAYNIAVDNLYKAKLYKNGNNKPTVLENPIKVSMHTLVDIIEALARGVTPNEHFRMITLLFEQLAYRANPNASYDLSY
jgi:hypothetical protein